MHLGLLYRRVLERGGFENVTHYKMWARVRDDFDVDTRVATSASSHLRKLYEQWLLPIEQGCASFFYLFQNILIQSGMSRPAVSGNAWLPGRFGALE